MLGAARRDWTCRLFFTQARCLNQDKSKPLTSTSKTGSGKKAEPRQHKQVVR